jgi:O-antigen/teichoic acid export membrane protein
MGYKKDAIRGVTWIGGYRGITRVFSVIRTVVLARILSPDQFGVYAIAVTVLSFLEIFTETGINTVLIQQKDKVEKYINTAWVVSIVRGIIISVVLFFLAPVIGNFFGSPSSIELIRFTALVPLVRGFLNPSIVRLQTELRFKQEFFIRTAIFILDSTVAVTLALLLKSPFALIYGLLSGAVLEIVFSYLLFKPKPTFEFHSEKLSFILSHGKWLTFTGMFDYLYQNSDNILVGRMLGTGPLGLYQTAYQFATMPVTEVSNILSRVTFPLLIKISDNQKRLFDAYIKTLVVTVLVVSPLSLLFIFFPNVVITILGDKWVGITDALRVLGILGVVRSVVLSAYAPLLANKRQDAVSIISMTGAIALLIMLPILIPSFGIVGAALAAVGASFISLIPAVFFVRQIYTRS